ncbi:MAG: hypothetical protein R2838_00200 [Caldilineaceae bacterium]
MVSTYTADLGRGDSAHTYTPGTVDMGSAWNRYGVPGQSVEDGGVTVDTRP